MSQTSIKMRFIAFVKKTALELSESQAHLTSFINKRSTSSAFGESAFKSLQLAESAFHALNFTPDYIDGVEFGKLGEEAVTEMLVEEIDALERREAHFFKNGLNERCTIDASGIMQIKVGLKQVLKGCR